MIPTLIRSYLAAAAIEGFRIVKFSAPAASRDVITATANDEPFAGTSDRMGASLGGMCDVVRSGFGCVQLGGAVSAGDPLTSDDEGKAVKAVPAAGETISIVGYADAPGVADDIIDYLVAPGLLHEPAAA